LDYALEATQGALDIYQRFTDLRIQQIQQEMNALEFARDRDLAGAEDNERKKLLINREYDAKRRELERKQLAAQKKQALFEIALNTAVAISKVAGNPILTAIAAAVGAAQAAIVVAQPLPEFDEGSDYTPKDYIAGEKGSEFRKSKGKWSLVNKPTVFNNSPGDKIVSRKETDSILSGMQDMTGGNILSDKQAILNLLNDNFNEAKRPEDLAYVLEKNNERLIDTIKNKKEIHMNVNTRRINIDETYKGRRISRIDKYYRP
jgi:hypothetical protein